MGTSEKSLSGDGKDAAGGASPVLTQVPSPEAPATWDPEEERKLVRKIDFLLIPACWAISLLAFMDRANLGNASIAGLNADLKLDSNQFSMSIITFYFGYIVWVPFGNFILSRVRPSLYFPLIMFLWGAVTAGMAGIKSYPQLLGLRTILGVLEAGVAPGVTLMFSCWYRPEELGKRSSVFMTAGQLGGAFGGLIAGGVMTNLEGSRGLRGWRWLFLVEGIVTMFCSVVAAFVLPDYPANCKKLTQKQRDIAIARLKKVGIVVTEDTTKRGEVLATAIPALKRALKDWRTYAFAVASAFVSAALLMAYFYPPLVRGLGYKDPIMAQYMTVPIWVVAFVFAMCAGWICDRWPHYRAWLIVSGFGLLSVMAIAACAVYDFTARYVLLAFMTGGLWGGFSQSLAYIAEVFQEMPPEVRAVQIGVMTAAANTGNIYGAYLWPAENAPKHLLGFGMVASTSAVAAFLFWVIWFGDTRKRRLAARAQAQAQA